MVYQTAVITGKGRGKRIGFPTLNLQIPDAFGATHGIYAGRVTIRGTVHPAAIHYGPIPTFHEVVPTLEAYLLDTQLIEPPREVEFELVAYIREIKEFLTPRELSAQISADVEDVKKILKTHKPSA